MEEGEGEDTNSEDITDKVKNLDITSKEDVKTQPVVEAAPETTEPAIPALVETVINSLPSVTATSTASAVTVESTAVIEKPSFTSYFIGRKDPCPRINSCLMMKYV